MTWLFRHRDFAALTLTLALMLGVWSLMQWQRLMRPALVHAPEMVVALEDLPPEPPAPTPPTPVSPPPMPTPSQPAPVRSTPAPQINEAAPTTHTATPAPQAPAEPAPAAPPTPTPPAPAPTPAPVHPATPPVQHANLEAGYVATLRKYLDGIKRYPSGREARQSRPTGTVRVWLELDRNGQLRDAGIETGSGSMLLDHEALRTVRGGQYPPFPPDAFAGENVHRFAVGLDYRLDNPN